MTDPRDEPFWQCLEEHGSRTALIDDDEIVRYADMASRADAWTASLRSQLPDEVAQPLVCLELSRRVTAILAYVGCLRSGWPVILLAEGEAGAESRILAEFKPNVVVRADGSIEVTDAEPAPFGEGLAVLLSTSGTTGASKLVRLSQGNIDANARSIVEYLDITPEDRAITTLPLHYSFGMSVLHSHLVAGASLVVCDDPLTEPAFWERARRAKVTSLAMVPTQYELLERLGFSEDWLPSLRVMTQAGGRLDPILAESFARRAAAKGWKFFLMYGQTEASPRIAYLPPEEAVEHFDKIGRPVPVGSLGLEDGEGGVIAAVEVPGELVYSGPNVMIGYASRREDLARPKDTFALRTGDIAVRTASGHFRIVGRTSRFLKLNGLRIGLDEVEGVVRQTGRRALASGDDRGLVVFVMEPGGEVSVSEWLTERFHLMPSSVTVKHLADPPLLASGKVDYRKLRGMAEALLSERAEERPQADLMKVLSRVLRRADLDPQRSFRDFGGDSLGFLEVELYLSKALGEVPERWEQMPISALMARLRESGGGRQPRLAGLQRIGTDIPIRVLAVLWVILLHSTSLGHGGGVYALAILAGHSLARHQMTQLLSGRVWQTLLTMLRPLVIGYLVLLAVVSLKFGVDWRWLAFIANFWIAEEIPIEPDVLMPYWFVSAYVQAIIAVSFLFLWAPVRVRVAQDPFLPGLLVTAVLTAVAAQWPLVPEPADMIRLPDGFLVLFGLGWCIAVARTQRQRVLASAFAFVVWFVCWRDIDLTVDLAILVTAGFMLWMPKVAVPGMLARGLREIAALTLFIYLMHVPALLVGFFLAQTEIGIFVVTLGLSLLGAAFVAWIYRRGEGMVQAIWPPAGGAETVGQYDVSPEDGSRQ